MDYKQYVREAVDDIRTAQAVNVAGVDPLTASALLANGAVSWGSQALDGALGNTTAINSGEVPLNYLIQALGSTVGAVPGFMIGSMNHGKKSLEELLSEIPEVTREKSSVQAKDMKEELKRLLATEGETAAKEYFADRKNSSASNAEYEAKVKAREKQVAETVRDYRAARGNRRMAGTALGMLTGSTLALPFMIDSEY